MASLHRIIIIVRFEFDTLALCARGILAICENCAKILFIF